MTGQPSRTITFGRFPFDQNFRVAFPKIFGGEWHSILHNFQHRGQLSGASDISYWEFLFHFICSLNLREFLDEMKALISNQANLAVNGIGLGAWGKGVG